METNLLTKETESFITNGNNFEICAQVLPAALTHPTLRTLPASSAQGGGDQRGVQAAAVVTVATATTHQQTANVINTRT